MTDDFDIDIEVDNDLFPTAEKFSNTASENSDGTAALTQQQYGEDDGIGIDIGDTLSRNTPPKPTLPIEVDLAKVAPEKRELILANADIAGITVLNRHLVEEVKKAVIPETRALLMEFPENPPPEVTGMKPMFRMNKHDDLDILFTGLPVGPIFQDHIEYQVKNKFMIKDSPDDVLYKHFVVYVYMAIALPFGQNPGKNNGTFDSGWGLTPFCPKEFERVMPKALRVHLGIDLWFKHSENRFDAVWYRVEEVSNEEEREASIKRSTLVAGLGWGILSVGNPRAEIPAQSIKKWEDEYFAKHPEEREKRELVESIRSAPTVALPTEPTLASSPAKHPEIKPVSSDSYKELF